MLSHRQRQSTLGRYTHFSLRTAIIFGMFGFIPGFWNYAIFFLFTYGLLKEELLANALLLKYRALKRFWAHFSQNVGTLISDHFTDEPIKFLRGVASFFLFTTVSMPYSFLGIYGMYRFSGQEWRAVFSRRLDGFYHFYAGLVLGISRPGASFSKKLTGVLGVLALLGLAVYASGSLLLLELSFLGVQFALVAVGLTAFLRDAKRFLERPLQAFLSNSGKLLGMLWGRWLAYQIFPGKVTGNMGPVLGHVQTYGIIPGLTSSFLSPTGLFTFKTGLVKLLFSNVLILLSNIISGVFFSYNMRFSGDFYGYVGPTSFQIFFFMAAVSFIGYGIENGLDSLFETVSEDYASVKEKMSLKTRDFLNLLYGLRWHFGYVTGMTSLLLVSNSRAFLLQASQGSITGAAAIAAMTVTATLTVIYGAAFTLSYLGRRLLGGQVMDVAPAPLPDFPLEHRAVLTPLYDQQLLPAEPEALPSPDLIRPTPR